MNNKELYEEYKKYNYDFYTLLLSDEEYKKLLKDKTLKGNYFWTWNESPHYGSRHVIAHLNKDKSKISAFFYPYHEPLVARPYAPELLLFNYRYTTKEIERKLVPIIDKVIKQDV